MRILFNTLSNRHNKTSNIGESASLLDGGIVGDGVRLRPLTGLRPREGKPYATACDCQAEASSLSNTVLPKLGTKAKQSIQAVGNSTKI